MSSRIASKRSVRARSRPCCPSAAVTTSYPRFRRPTSQALRSTRSSSTSSIRFDIHSLDRHRADEAAARAVSPGFVPDAAAELLEDQPGHEQAQAGSFRLELLYVVGAEELLEQARARRLRNPDARVLDDAA